MTEGEILLAKYDQIRQLGSTYQQIFKDSIGKEKWELIKATRKELKAQERKDHLADLQEKKRVQQESYVLSKKLSAAAEKVARLRFIDENKARKKVLREPDPVSLLPVIKPTPAFATSVNSSGEIVLHLDHRTTAILKPGHDPETVFNKYMRRDSYL